MLEKFNSFMEKWMAFVTPACLLTGVLFPDIAKHGVPYVTYAFAFMTFIGALNPGSVMWQMCLSGRFR